VYRVSRLGRLLAAAPLSYAAAIKRATSHGATGFRGVAVVAREKPCFKSWVKDTLTTWRAECNAPPMGWWSPSIQHFGYFSFEYYRTFGYLIA